MSLQKNIKIMVVDDHQLIRDAVEAHLQNERMVSQIFHASNGLEALEMAQEQAIDIAFMDINMEEMDGITATRELKKVLPNCKVIALSMLKEPHYIRQMFEAGASGFLLKNCSSEDIKNAMETVLEDKLFYSPEVAETLIQGLTPSPKKPSFMDQTQNLTKREKEILSLIAQEYSNKEIAEKLFISIRTVDAHKRNLLEKTGAKNTVGLVLLAVKLGIIDPQ